MQITRRAICSAKLLEQAPPPLTVRLIIEMARIPLPAGVSGWRSVLCPLAAAAVLLVLICTVASAMRTGTSAPARVAPVATGVNLRRRRPAYKRGGSPLLRGVLWTLVPFVPVVAGVR